MRGQRLPSTQEHFVALRDVRAGMLCLAAPDLPLAGRRHRVPAERPVRQERRYRAVLQVGSANFALASDAEQEAILAGYAALLNGLGYPVQILVRVLPLDLTPYMAHLGVGASDGRMAAQRAVAGQMAGEPHPMGAITRPLLARLAADHAAFVRHLAAEHTLLERRFYLVLPAEDTTDAGAGVAVAQGIGGGRVLEALTSLLPGVRRARLEARHRRRVDALAQRLDLRVDDVTRQLTRFGVEARRLLGGELVELYAGCLSPITAPAMARLAGGISDATDALTDGLPALPAPRSMLPSLVPSVSSPSQTTATGQGGGGGGDARTAGDGLRQIRCDDAVDQSGCHEDDEQYVFGAQTLPDLVAPAAVEVFRDGVRIDDTWARVLAVTAYPRSVYPGWLATLIDLDEPFDLALHIRPLASGAMIRHLSNRMVALHSSRLLDERHGRLADPEREVAYADMDRLRDALQRGDEHVFSLSLYLLVRGRTRRALDERCARLHVTLDNLQLGSRPATLEHDLGLTSCLPEGRDRLARYRTFDTSSLATAFPFTSSGLSMAHGILYGVMPQTGSLVILDPFSRELENANQVVFAKSGAGKSYACKLQALRALLLGAEVYVVDPEDEYRPICDAVGGQHIRLAPGSGQHINPFDLPPLSLVPPPRHSEVRMDEPSVEAGSASDMETRESGDLLAEKIQSLHALLDLMLADRTPSGAVGLSQREKGLLDRCLYETYRRAGITSDHRTHDRLAPLLRDLFDVLRSGTCGADEYGLADRLHRYVEGSLARLFSAPTDVALDRHLVVFDVRDLDGELRPLGLLLIADFVWTRVRQKRQPRLLLIDEAWSLIQHQEGGRFLAGLARRARKYWLGLVTITQDVEDFLGSEWGRTVLANSSIQLLMKQDSTTIEAVFSAFRLSSGERQYLLGCHKGEGLLFARGGHVALRVEASPAEHDLVTTDPRELAERAELPGSVERSGQSGQLAPEEQPRRSHPGPTEGQANMPWALPRAGTDVRAAPDSPPPGPRSRQEGSPPTAPAPAPAAMTKKAPARPEHSGVPGARLASRVDDTPDTVDAEDAEVTEDAADSRADTRIHVPRWVSATTGSAGDARTRRNVGAPDSRCTPGTREAYEWAESDANGSDGRSG